MSRKITLSTGSRFKASEANSVANQRTEILRFRVPVASRFGLRRTIAPVIDFRKANGSKVSPRTRVFIGGQGPTDESPAFLPGSFEIAPHVDLSTTDQRKAENRGPDGTLRHDLGAPAVWDEDDELIVVVEGPDVIDIDHPDTVFELDVLFRAVGV